MTMESNYLIMSGNALAELRMRIEGMILLYEEDTLHIAFSVLFRVSSHVSFKVHIPPLLALLCCGAQTVP